MILRTKGSAPKNTARVCDNPKTISLFYLMTNKDTDDNKVVVGRTSLLLLIKLMSDRAYCLEISELHKLPMLNPKLDPPRCKQC